MGKDVFCNTRIKNLKPDFDEAAARMEAYWNGDMLDRPIAKCILGKPNYEYKVGSDYYIRAVSGDLTEIVQNTLHNARGAYYLGEAMPNFWTSFGTHEIATFLDGEAVWNPNSGDTVWTKPYVKDWNDVLPLKVNPNNPNWRRMVEMYEKCAEIFQGEILPFAVDFHTNMDLLLSIRGDEELSYDVYDCPELIDKAMEGAREVFKYLWETVKEVGQMDKYGYWFDAFSKNSTSVLACDYICMISPEMVRRWFIPTIEFEADLVDNVIFHWDGPGAIKHKDDILAVKKIHSISFVPNPFEDHIKYLDLYKECQKAGKAVVVGGNFEQIKVMFKELKPNMTMYNVYVNTVEEFEQVTKWMKSNV